jgi:hypothetical protein
MASIFSGVDDIIDETLSIQTAPGKKPKFSHRAAACHLTERPCENIGEKMISKIYQQMCDNWLAVSQKPTASPKLWVPRIRPMWSLKYESAEVPLERSTVTVFGAYQRSDDELHGKLMWFNQIPVAAGLVSSREGRNAIDLVCRTDHGKYDFIELKFRRSKDLTQTPLGAGMEILKNGMVYLFLVSNLSKIREQNHYQPKFNDGDEANWLNASSPEELLGATEVSLCVLGPKRFYAGFSLGWLEYELNAGLETFLKRQPQENLRRMIFRYEYLPDRPFHMTDGNGFTFDFTRTHLLLNQWPAL